VTRALGLEQLPERLGIHVARHFHGAK
jgi:hypothetical protein